MGTGKENGSQKWLPEKNWYLKYGYRKRIGISNMVTRKELVSQILLTEYFSSSLLLEGGGGGCSLSQRSFLPLKFKILRVKTMNLKFGKGGGAVICFQSIPNFN